MLLLHSVDEIPRGLRFVATVGVFDGLHRGHREVLNATSRAAARFHARSLVITFEPHPETVLRGTTPLLLCDPAEKLAGIAAAGIDVTVIQRFDRAFSEQTAEAFLDRLRAGRQLAGLVMSSESAFGHDRQGTAATVRRLAEEEGWHLLELHVIESGGLRVSSRQIRDEIGAGRLGTAARLLGRRYAVIGDVVHGNGRGHQLGFPTANLHFDAEVSLPPDGIYAGRVTWWEGLATDGSDALRAPDHAADGVASLGVRPTFGESRRLLEVHLLDFDGDLYGRRLRLEFVRLQRGERRFETVAALVEQMGRDVARTRRNLARTQQPEVPPAGTVVGASSGETSSGETSSGGASSGEAPSGEAPAPRPGASSNVAPAGRD